MFVESVNGTELRFKNPGSLLLIVFAFVFWGVGFLDLLGHKSAEPDLFGLYSLPLFILIVIYGCSIVIWFALFINATLLAWVADRVKALQRNTRLAILFFIGLGAALWVIFEWDRWARLPGLQFAAFGLLVLTFLILLFANWQVDSRVQPWRRIIAYPLFVLVALEVVLQAAAWMDILPGRYRIGGDFYPYERIYYNEAGMHNHFANRYGWNFPDTELEEDGPRILIVGGGYVQALPVLPEQQLGVLLAERLNQDLEESSLQTEVVSVGMPGFGLSPFLYEDVITELPELIGMDEIIVFFHLGDDFQSPVSDHTSIRYTVGEADEVNVHPDDARLRHDLTHYYLRGYMSFQLVETLRSNYLTPKVVGNLIRSWQGSKQASFISPEGGNLDFSRQVGHVSDFYAVTEEGHAGIKTTELETIPEGNNFMFELGGNANAELALVIAERMLETAQEIARVHGVTLLVVTIPEFPEAVYDSFQGDPWQTEVGEYDLLLPEQALVEIAQKHQIPILPMGQYMLKDGLTVQEIRALYFSNDVKSFTPDGHDYFSAAIYSCFYADEADSSCSR